VRVLFGGKAFVRSTANLSMAHNARQRFFQLILAAGVVLATLVIADWLLASLLSPKCRGERRVMNSGASQGAIRDGTSGIARRFNAGSQQKTCPNATRHRRH